MIASQKDREPARTDLGTCGSRQCRTPGGNFGQIVDGCVWMGYFHMVCGRGIAQIAHGMSQIPQCLGQTGGAQCIGPHQAPRLVGAGLYRCADKADITCHGGSNGSICPLAAVFQVSAPPKSLQIDLFVKIIYHYDGSFRRFDR